MCYNSHLKSKESIMSDIHEIPNQPNVPAEPEIHSRGLRSALIVLGGVVAVAALATFGERMAFNDSPQDGRPASNAEPATQPSPSATETATSELSPSPVDLPTALPTPQKDKHQIVILKPNTNPSPSAHNTIPVLVQARKTHTTEKDIPASDKIVETSASQLRSYATGLFRVDDLRYTNGRIYGSTRRVPITSKPSQDKPSFLPNTGKIRNEIVGSVTEITDFVHPGVTYIIERHESKSRVDQGFTVGTGHVDKATLRIDGPLDNPTKLKSLTLTSENVCPTVKGSLASAILCQKNSTQINFNLVGNVWKMHHEEQSIDPGFAIELTDADVETFVSRLISDPDTAPVYEYGSAPLK